MEAIFSDCHIAVIIYSTKDLTNFNADFNINRKNSQMRAISVLQYFLHQITFNLMYNIL